MARTPIWHSIATTLATEIAMGQYTPGDKLPTEAELSARFGVNRHTVRRALSDLGDKGVVHARRGAGVFVAAKPTEYALGRRVRFSQNLAAAGLSAERKILLRETRAANPREAAALNLAAGDPVHVSEGISFADGAPLTLSRHVFPAARFPGLLKALEDEGSITRALLREGLADYTRASTKLVAKLATATQALHLRIAEGAPILRTISVNVDSDGQPVEYGHAWFAGDRVTLVVTPE